MRRVPRARRSQAESSGFAGALACVVAALFLYVVGTLVWGFDDEPGEGLLSAIHVSPHTGAIE